MQNAICYSNKNNQYVLVYFLEILTYNNDRKLEISRKICFLEYRIRKGDFMNLAKISANGQITVPVEIRKKLGLKSGDKILFFQKPNGDIVINNASAQAIYKTQAAFEGVAEAMGVYNDEDVQALVNEVRYGKDNE